MCTSSTNLISCSPLYSAYGHRMPSKRQNLQVRGLNRRRRRSTKDAREKEMMNVKTEMEIKNLKLYMENKIIIEENEKLRKKALLLHQENQALLSQLQKKSIIPKPLD